MKKHNRVILLGLLAVCMLPLSALQAGTGPAQPPEIRDVTLVLTPIQTQVPQTGGMVIFDFSVTSTIADTLDIWFDLGLPDGQVIGPYYIWWSYIFSAGGTAMKHCLLYISPMCMPNQYTIFGKAGSHCAGEVLASDDFAFAKAVSGPPGAPPPRTIGPVAQMGDGMGEGTLIATDGQGAAKLNLLSVAPQPCNPEVSIAFSLLEAGDVQISLYNIQGSRVVHKTLAACAAGAHTFTLPTTEFASGMYLLSLEAGGTVMQRPLAVVK